MKSMMSRPSENLPEGLPKKVSTYGRGIRSKAADLPPVSEFESPKLYMVGNLHLPDRPPTTAAETGFPPTNFKSNIIPNAQIAPSRPYIRLFYRTVCKSLSKKHWSHWTSIYCSWSINLYKYLELTFLICHKRSRGWGW